MISKIRFSNPVGTLAFRGLNDKTKEHKDPQRKTRIPPSCTFERFESSCEKRKDSLTQSHKGHKDSQRRNVLTLVLLRALCVLV